MRLNSGTLGWYNWAKRGSLFTGDVRLRDYGPGLLVSISITWEFLEKRTLENAPNTKENRAKAETDS